MHDDIHSQKLTYQNEAMHDEIHSQKLPCQNEPKHDEIHSQKLIYQNDALMKFTRLEKTHLSK